MCAVRKGRALEKSGHYLNERNKILAEFKHRILTSTFLIGLIGDGVVFIVSTLGG